MYLCRYNIYYRYSHSEDAWFPTQPWWVCVKMHGFVSPFVVGIELQYIIVISCAAWGWTWTGDSLIVHA